MTHSTTDRTGPVPIVVRQCAACRAAWAQLRTTTDSDGRIASRVEKSTVAVDPGEGPQDDVAFCHQCILGSTPARQDT